MPSPYDALVADDGPLGNPFEGMPLFGDIARMLGQQGGGAWDGARQLAISVATEGTSEPNVDPVERMRIEQLARVADLRVADATGLSTSVGGRAVSVLPVNRTRWVMDSLEAYRPLVERLAEALGPQEVARGRRARRRRPDRAACSAGCSRCSSRWCWR